MIPIEWVGCVSVCLYTQFYKSHSDDNEWACIHEERNKWLRTRALYASSHRQRLCETKNNNNKKNVFDFLFSQLENARIFASKIYSIHENERDVRIHWKCSQTLRFAAVSFVLRLQFFCDCRLNQLSMFWVVNKPTVGAFINENVEYDIGGHW